MIEKLNNVLSSEHKLAMKLNEVIDVVNDRASIEERLFGNHPELAQAAKKAATTGSHADLQEYLKLRRRFL